MHFFLQKTRHFAFLAPFRGLKATHTVLQRLIGKRIVEFLLAIIIGARRIFSRGGQIRGSGDKSASRVQGWSPDGVGGEAPEADEKL